MQNLIAFTILVTFLTFLFMGSLAIDCYVCTGSRNEDGGCGQDPFSGHFVSTPDVDTTSDNAVCYVLFQIKLLYFYYKAILFFPDQHG